MFCQQCGKPVAAGVRYCPHCGANVAEQTPSPSSAPGTQPAAGAAEAGSMPPSGQYAGFWFRLGACFIDGLILGAMSLTVQMLLGFGLGFGLGFDASRRPGDMADIFAILGLVGISIGANTAFAWLYEALLTSSHWQATVGKRALGIVVTDENGGRISFLRATGRHFAKWISALLLFAGYLIQPFTPKRQALHDILSGTLVIKP